MWKPGCKKKNTAVHRHIYNKSSHKFISSVHNFRYEKSRVEFWPKTSWWLGCGQVKAISDLRSLRTGLGLTQRWIICIYFLSQTREMFCIHKFLPHNVVIEIELSVSHHTTQSSHNIFKQFQIHLQTYLKIFNIHRRGQAKKNK